MFMVSSLKKLLPKDAPKVLGRWNIDYCNKKINNKIDWSNEDHCGPCGQYILHKKEQISNSLHMLEPFPFSNKK